MATTVAQPGTALKKVAKKYADQAGMPVDQFLQRLRRLNPDYKRAQGSDALRLGRGVRGSAAAPEQAPIDTPEGAMAPESGAELMDILDSPLYTQELKDYYLSQYLPGLTQTTFDINQAQTEFGANEATRGRQRGEAIKRIAGSYAARGMRSPGAINKDRSRVQSEFADISRQERAGIESMKNQRDIMFGAGAQNGETFIANPNMFGSIGMGARRSALSGLQRLPEQYGFLGVNRANTAPGNF